MQKPPIATIINFCTIEARFIKACIEECRHFSSQIIVPVCDHFFNGQKENLDLLRQIYLNFPDCLFVEYPFVPKKIPKRLSRQISPGHFWHCVSRMVGVQFVDPAIEMVLFLDADEVPEGKKFLEWLEMSAYADHTVLKLANYWYFRDVRYQAQEWEDSIVLSHKKMLGPSVLLHENERDAIFDSLPNPKRRTVTGFDSQPMFHHFSWVRTKEEMLEKVRSWGHRLDRDWEKLVEDEFATPFRGKDFVHGYSFRECSPIFDISMDHVKFSQQTNQLSHLKRIDEQELIRYLDSSSGGYLQRMWKTFFNNEPLCD